MCLGPVLQSPHCERVCCRVGRWGPQGHTQGQFCLVRTSRTPPYRGKLASKKKEKKETVKINKQGSLLETPTRQDMTRSAKIVTNDPCQELQCLLILCFFFLTYLYSKEILVCPVWFPSRETYIQSKDISPFMLSFSLRKTTAGNS